MRTIQVQELTKEKFEEYGSYYSITNPSGHNLGDFYHDHVLYPVSGNEPIGFSALITHKHDSMIVSAAEYHNSTSEILLPIDGDVVIHVASPSNRPVPELTEAFYVPRGTVVKLNTGVWHLAPFAMDCDEVHVLVVLPERIYFNDCVVVEYDEEQKIEIVKK